MKKLDSFVGGIDVCSENGEIQWQNIKTSKTMFVMVKATEGTESGSALPCLEDSMFASNVREAYMHGLRVGAYHYLTAKSVSEAKEQGMYFVETIKKMDHMINFYCGVVLTEWDDIESADLYLDVCCGMISSAGYKPIVYAPLEFLAGISRMAYSLWFPHTEQDINTFPLCVRNHIVLWQYKRVSVKGIEEDIYRTALIRPEVLLQETFTPVMPKYPDRKKRDPEDLEANAWALRCGIIQAEDGILHMQETITREEVMILLRRFTDMWKSVYGS